MGLRRCQKLALRADVSGVSVGHVSAKTDSSSEETVVLRTASEGGEREMDDLGSPMVSL
jgi:hypothetical protein